MLTNIVVVQFSEMVQTSRDKRYNLTCLYGGPGEAVVTSGYIGAGYGYLPIILVFSGVIINFYNKLNRFSSGSPTPIEFLPAQNILDSRVRLLIMYQGRPTTTIAVGDPLTFKLESLQGYNLISDIFATNVIAKDPYTGKSVQLIDRFGYNPKILNIFNVTLPNTFNMYIKLFSTISLSASHLLIDNRIFKLN